MLRFLRLILEAIAAIIAVGVILGLLLVWRVSSKPINSDFMTPYIEAGIESILPGSKVNIGSTLLTWDDVERTISVHAEALKVEDAKGQEIANIPSFDGKISVIGLVFGQFLPKDLMIDHPQIKLERNKAGIFIFGTVEMGGDEKPSPKTTSTDEQATIVAAIRNITQHLAHAALMHKLAVSHAVFDVHDDVTHQNWSVSVPEISVSRSSWDKSVRNLASGALTGRITIEITQKDTVASVDVQYAYDPTNEAHSLSTVFTGVTPSFMAGGHPETLGLGAAAIIELPLTGKAQITLDRDLHLKTATAEIHGDEGNFVYSDFWEKPVPVKSLDVNVDFDKDKEILTLSGTHLDLGGPTLSLDVDGVRSKQEGKDLDFSVVAKVNNFPMNSYDTLWPKPVLPDPRYWLVSNLRDGMFVHAEARLKGSLAWDDLSNLSVTEGGGKLSAVSGRVVYLDGMPAAENVDADAVFDLNKMDVTITSGGIGPIRMQPFTVRITGLSEPDQDIDIPLQVAGPIPEILRLLDHQPLGYAKALGLSPEDIGGTIEGSVLFHFPLLKTLETKDLTIHAKAKASAVTSTKLVPGIAIDQGTLDLTLDTSGFALKGQAGLNKIPFQVTLQQNFEAKPDHPLRHITATGVIKDEQWNNFGIKIFNGSTGSMNVALDIVNPDKKKMNITGTVEMTPSTVRVGMLNWDKPANIPASLKFSATTAPDKNVAVTGLALEGNQIHIKGRAQFSHDLEQLLSLNLDTFILGRTDATLQFDQTFGDSGAQNFDVRGSAFDISGLRDGNEPDTKDRRSKAYNLKVDKLYTGKAAEVDNAEIVAMRDQQGWSAFSFHGLADGDAALSIDLTPQPEGYRTLEIHCDNFGKMMKGLGFTDTIKGGKFLVSGRSTVDNPRTIIGSTKINDFTVEKLPVLALLLNATSPFGFAGILTDSADFSRFKGDFKWQGDTVTLTQAHAAGSAIGINIDGKVDMNSGDANLQGTLVPFSTFNNILNFIPLIGDILTGGEDQGVLAVSYTIKGSLGSPQISVNPVSLLTPGFLRNLFFSDETGDDDK